nr:IucA/IucC family protein [Neobacillus sp. Marseille-Q6967]
MKTSSTQLLEKISGPVSKEEWNTLYFLQQQHPEMAAEYVQLLSQGRFGILRRLAGSLLRENIMEISSNSHDLYVIDSIYALNVPQINEYWQRIISVLNNHGLKSGKVYKLYSLSNGQCLVFPVSKTYAFNRVEIEGDILHIFDMEVRTLEHPVELLELIQYKSRQGSFNKLADELRNGSANLALSYTYWRQKKKGLQKEAWGQGITNTIDWVLTQKRQDPVFDSSLFFERLSVEGHNLHPGTKTKIGMEPEDVFLYAPEFDGITDIQFVAIRKDYAEWSVVEENEEDANRLLFTEYPELPKAAAEQGICLYDYVFVPVHSWQLEHAIEKIYEKEIGDNIVIPIRGFVVPCGATSSFRTVVPVGRGPKLAIKVAVNSQMTSTVRSISPQTTNNAAVFTRLVCSIMEREPNLIKTFVPICERAGYNFKAKDGESTQTLKSRNLSAVLRENVETFLNENEVAIVGSSLFAESPFSEKSILEELIEKYAAEQNVTSLRKAAFKFVSEYLSIALPGFLTLMVKYGIGLEGHLQNSVMVYKDGRPVRMLFRDWGGARIFQPRLQQQQISVSFYPGSVTLTANIEEMHNKVFYTVSQNQCGELILQVCKTYGIREEELWQEVHRICSNVFNHLDSQPLYMENARLDKDVLYQEKVDHKALTKMRLEPDSKSYCYTKVANPLYKFRGKEG